ncbi:MAG TPA: protein kinase [Polyangiales bacterium]|nr:protein kinase [Polyangiales bacterium]
MSTANCAAEDALIGSRIDGRYTLHRVLGQGGMGVVYEGVHDELGRSVAIKVLNAAWASDRTAVERFLREARTASSFSHSNIVDVSDLGRLADGRPYLVMPKVTGIDLATLLSENGPQPAKRVAALLGGVASALDLVHAKGFVHRDIKPENLMYVVREDGSETVMLLDFGIAAAVMSSGPRLTRQGAIFGTPHYLPPEVCTGERCDARGDVYSLASVAFEMIAGVLPFGAEDIMQLMAQKVSYDAPSLAAVTGAQFPAELEQVLATGLARDPRYRYASASTFVSALRSATNSAPVSWRTGVVRPTNTRSAEHELPVASGRPGWDAERAPTWPIDTGSQETEEPSTDVHPYPPARSGFAPRHTPSRYADESSAVQSASGYPSEARRPSEPSYPRGSGRSGHPSEPSYPRGSGHPSEPSYPRGSGHPSEPSYPRASGHSGHPSEPSYPARAASYPARSQALNQQPRPLPNPTANPGVWAAHKQPHTPYPPSREQLHQEAYDQRLRMEDERRRTLAVQQKSSMLPVLVGVAAFAALGMGGVQLYLSRRASPETDARASTLSTPAPTQPAAAPSARPDVSPRPQAHAASPAVPPKSFAPSKLPPAAPTVAARSVIPPRAAEPEGLPEQPVAAEALPTENPTPPAQVEPTPQPERPAPSNSARAERARPHVNIDPMLADPPAPQAAAAPSSVLSVTPIQAPVEPVVEPEPPAAPVADSAGAANYAKQSSGALLRGELTRAIDLARRGTQADPDYAIAWRSLGLAYERAGSSDQAMSAYREYLQRAPTGPQAEMVRQRMQALAP